MDEVLQLIENKNLGENELEDFSDDEIDQQLISFLEQYKFINLQISVETEMARSTVVDTAQKDINKDRDQSNIL